MSDSVGWNINELDQLSLFGEMTLNSGQLKGLPPHIYKGILKGYSEVLNQMNLPDSLVNLRFAAKTDADGVIWIRYDGQDHRAGNLKDHQGLHKAMCQAHSIAKTHFSTAFRDAPTVALPSPEIFVVQDEPLAGTRDANGDIWFEYKGEERQAGNINQYPDLRTAFRDEKKPFSVAFHKAPPIGEIAEVGLDVNGIARNLSTALSTASAALEFIAISGVMSGLTVLWAAIRGLTGANKRYTRATEIDDPEGKVLAGIGKVNGVVRSFAGMTQIAGSVSSTLRTIAKLQIPTAAVKGLQYVGVAGSVLGLMRATLFIGSTMYEWPQLSAFREGLHWILKSNLSQQQKALEGLGFLQQQLTLTAEDLREIDNLDEEAKEHKIAEKRDRLVRRLGEDLVKEIENESGDLIDRLQMSDPNALELAKGLIERVDQASFIKRVRQITMLVICTITILATIASLVFTGPAIPILFAVTNLLWLSIDSTWLHQRIGYAAHALLKPGSSRIWGNSQQTDSNQFWRDLEDPYVTIVAGQRVWNLDKLRAAVETSIQDPRRQYILNGKHITSFALAVEELGLKDIGSNIEDKLTPTQRAGLQWLTTFAGDLLALPQELFSDTVTPGNEAEIEPTGRLIVQAHYNRERGVGMLRASQKADYPLDSAKHPLALRLDIHGTDRVHAGWSGHGADWSAA